MKNRLTRESCQRLGLAIALLLSFVASRSLAQEQESPPVDWLSDYGLAIKQAQAESKMVLIHFHLENDAPDAIRAKLNAALADKDHKYLEQFVPVCLSTNAEIVMGGKSVKLISHGAFAEMQGQPGISIIDYANKGTEQFGHVVTAIPFDHGKYYQFRPEHFPVLLDLPAGTLTQRTLVFAVRIHPEQPASTKGEIDTGLLEEAASHSNHQAQIHVQGHHNWESRFHRIGRRLPWGLRAQEVVAESWPHERLIDAAVDCVHSWRQSSGHWSAVRSRQNRFGYDMKRGTNGIWYATGIFGNRH